MEQFPVLLGFALVFVLFVAIALTMLKADVEKRAEQNRMRLIDEAERIFAKRKAEKDERAKLQNDLMKTEIAFLKAMKAFVEKR